jgi:ribose 5-phosphate isomerase B
MKRVVIGNDHGAVDLKRRLVTYLEEEGYEVVNMGIDSEDAVDYPDMAKVTCAEFKKGGYEFGILSCGTGIGISISANKISGIRCALVHDLFTAEKARTHNDANFIALGGRLEFPVAPEVILGKFISSRFEGEERHQRRVDKIMALEEPEG